MTSTGKQFDKEVVLEEVTVFNNSELDPRRCSQIITKLLYLLNQGEKLKEDEATKVFFAVTKLFHCKDAGVRRMVYLILKELSPSADETIIAISSLVKDMNSKTDMHRANAIRVLYRITDGTIITQIERYLKQAIVDKTPAVSSAALLSGIHLLQTNPAIVKRWINEVQEAVQSRAALVQFHAVALSQQILQDDPLAVGRLLTSLTKGNIHSPLAKCLLIRYISKVNREFSFMNSRTGWRPFYGYLEGCLGHKEEMVNLEAARVITNLRDVTSRELIPAITALKILLSSPKLVLRFAVVRTLHKVVMINPAAVISISTDIERLVFDQNVKISTLAASTLLRTGNKSVIESLMVQIAEYSLKIVNRFGHRVVKIIGSFYLRFPLESKSLMTFLGQMYCKKVAFEYKKAIVDLIVMIMEDVSDAKEDGLLHLSKFLVGNNDVRLCRQILYLLAIEGPMTSDPGKYIQYICNRGMVGVHDAIQASAMRTLARFAFYSPKACDRDKVIKCALEFLFDTSPTVKPEIRVKEYLQQYLEDTSYFSKSVPKATQSREPLSDPHFLDFGKLLKSSTPVELTETEADYAVNVVKHIFHRHVVFQYNCTNSIPEQLLENVTVVVHPSEKEFYQVGLQPLISLPYDSTGPIFVTFEKPQGLTAVGKFSNWLRFIVKEVDPSTGEIDEDGVEDGYQMEDVELVEADYIELIEDDNYSGINNSKCGGPQFQECLWKVMAYLANV